MITKKIDTLTLEEIWAQETDGHIPVLLEIYNPFILWGDNNDGTQEDCYLRVINDSNTIIFKGKKYIPCALSFKAPQEDGTKIGPATITISALDSRIQQMLEQIRNVSDVNVTAAFVKLKTENGKEIMKFRELSKWTFQMETANANRSTATFNLVANNVSNLNVPRDTMDKNQLFSMVDSQ